MGTLFLVVFLAVDIGAYKYLVSTGSDKEVANRICTGAFFVALAVQIAIDWLIKKQFRVFYLVVPIDSSDAKPIALISIVALVCLGTYMVIK